MEYTELLRCLAISDGRLVEDVGGMSDRLTTEHELDPKTAALVRLGALVAVGGAVPSYGAHADAAVDAGASAAEIVDVLLVVAPVVGLPRAVEAAPKLALALGYDTNLELD